MKAPLNWLKDYVDITLPPEELARRLTLAGFEVEEISSTGGNWENVFIGQITSVDPHPNADRLRLATVDLGTGQETVVCGAPNLNIGDKIAFASVGARLINPYNGEVEEIKQAKIRGVVSRGMICSEKELGISDNHEGIMVLPPEARTGSPLADNLGDIVFNVDITPNRPDCLSVIGIAREAAAQSGQNVHIPVISYEETASPIDEQISIEIQDTDLCPRYCASLITGVKIGESPAWMQERLLACGQRPINNIVDVTNYVMLEYGQPLHSFDYDKIAGKRIIARRGKEGESFQTLDGNTRTLTGEMTVIADAERSVAIAGIMGGANTEVTENTTTILLEAASFNPASIHYTSRHLSLISESSMRFERGISPGMTIPALKHATHLIAQLGGGRIARGIIDVYPGKKEAEPILLSTDETTRILGIEFSLEQITSALDSLGFTCKIKGGQVEVTVPYWRSDIRWEVDVIEEVARTIGYDRIPTTLLSEPLPHYIPEPYIALKENLRRIMAGYGFQEAVTFSLSSLEALSNLSPESKPPEPLPPRLTNPMTADLEYLRSGLRANLLTALAANRRHEDGGIRLFELGKIFLPRENDLPEEPDILCGLLCGDRVENSWLGGNGKLDFYDAKGIAEGLLKQLNIAAVFVPGNDEGLHPVRQATISAKKGESSSILGVVGELHPKVTDAFEITEPVCVLEINVAALLTFTTGYRTFRQILRFPSTSRDLALVLDMDIDHQRVLDIIGDFPLVSEVTLFDVYSGKQVADGKKSLAYRLVYQSETHTLTDEEVNKVQEQILKRLTGELGATLRG